MNRSSMKVRLKQEQQRNGTTTKEKIRSAKYLSIEEQFNINSLSVFYSNLSPSFKNYFSSPVVGYRVRKRTSRGVQGVDQHVAYRS